MDGVFVFLESKLFFPWTNEGKRLLRKEVDNGVSISDIADKFEHAPTAIALQLHEMGFNVDELE